MEQVRNNRLMMEYDRGDTHSDPGVEMTGIELMEQDLGDLDQDILEEDDLDDDLDDDIDPDALRELLSVIKRPELEDIIEVN